MTLVRPSPGRMSVNVESRRSSGDRRGVVVTKKASSGPAPRKFCRRGGPLIAGYGRRDNAPDVRLRDADEQSSLSCLAGFWHTFGASHENKTPVRGYRCRPLTVALALALALPRQPASPYVA